MYLLFTLVLKVGVDILRHCDGRVPEQILRILDIDIRAVQHGCICVPELMRSRLDAMALLVFFQAGFQLRLCRQAVREEDECLRVVIVRQDLDDVILQV